MLLFNPNGYLIPDDVVLTNLQTFQSEFVDAIVDENRVRIFDNFIHFCRSFIHDLGLERIVVFLNGSFTTKKRNPNDLDIVVFIHWTDFEKRQSIIKTEYQHDLLLKEKHLDVYFLVVYPENHRNHAHSQSDRAYWVSQFTRTRPNRKGEVYKKGLVQLTITAQDVEQI